MQMEQVGTQEVAKEFTFITPLDHGLSYKLANPHHAGFRDLVVSCLEYYERSIKRSNNSDYIGPVDFALSALEKQSDFWITVDSTEKLLGIFQLSKAEYPKSTGVYVEALAGEFNFEHGLPMIEDYYRTLGYQFVELEGRRGWERKLKQNGYNYKTTTIVKRL
jgi:hypothetical protein